MTDSRTHAANKKAVASGLRALFSVPVGELDRAVHDIYADAATLHAFHPVNEQRGAAAIAAGLWRPIRAALPDAERREQIVIGGDYEGADFVCTMSELAGTFANDWLGIPATRGVVSLRCCEINRVAGGRIVEAHVLIDVLDLMHQAGCWPIAPSLGSEGRWRGPRSQDGVRLDRADPEAGAAALELVRAMHRGLLSFDGRDLASMQHAQYWTPDFMWYGPSGIGTARGLAGFEAHHQVPFLRAFPDRTVATHIARVSDGAYVTTGGWPSVVATHSGDGWLGLPATGKRIGMRVMDFYRVENGLIAENWVPIDIVDIMRQMGVDVFARLAHRRGHPARAL